MFRIDFLPRNAMRKRGTSRRPLSVRLSVTLMYCIETAKIIIKLVLDLLAPSF